MGYKVYGVSVSPFVRKVLVLLAEKNIEFEYDPVNPFSPPEGYRDISPLGRIPGFTDGEKSLADSSVICTYIERENPATPMYPSDNYAFARALWYEEYIDGGFVPVAGAGVFRPLVVAPMMMKQPVTDDIRAEVDRVVREELSPMWDYLESELGDNDYYVGDTLTIADITVASIHVNLMHAGVDVDAARWPKLAAFLTRMHARPSFKAIIDEEIPVWSQRGA